jgi:esterase/lipase superfamily enzyme
MPERQVFFATNRLFDTAARRFGGVCCEPPDALMTGFGSCDVAADPVPEGSCDLDSLQMPDSPGTGLRETVEKWLATAAARNALPLLFTHGFNHRFPEALTRTAKLCAWYEADGAPPLLPLSFTWPSGAGVGLLGGYTADGVEVGRSGIALAKLIAAVADCRRPGQRVIYMAHSMGVRATRYGMQAIRPMLPALRRPVFAQAFLMAGDDWHDVLDRPEPGAPADASTGALRPVAEVAAHVTVGVNRADGVVWLISGGVNGGDRLGSAGPRRPEDLPGNVRVVDYSQVLLESGPDILVPQTETTANWVGHQYYRNAPLVRRDLVAAMRHDGPPETVPGRRLGQPGPFGAVEDPRRLYPPR